jgi:hypothetical protein
MRPAWRLLAVPILIALPAIAVADTESAGGIYRLDWYTVDGGGLIRSASTGGSPYHLGGTAGQPDAYLMSGGTYRLSGGFWSGAEKLGTVSAPSPEPAARPTVFRAVPPWPNPARGSAALAIELPDDRDVSIRVFDVDGHLVRDLASGRFAAGSHPFRWDGRGDDGRPAPPGLFFIRVEAGRDRGVSKLVLLSSAGGDR